VALASLKQHVETLMDERFQQVAAPVDERSQQAGQSGRFAPSGQRLSSQEATPLTDGTGNALTPCSFAVSSRSSSMTSAFNWNYPVTCNSSTASVATSPLPETVDGPQSPAPCQVTRIKASAWNHRTAGEHWKGAAHWPWSWHLLATPQMLGYGVIHLSGDGCRLTVPMCCVACSGQEPTAFAQSPTNTIATTGANASVHQANKGRRPILQQSLWREVAGTAASDTTDDTAGAAAANATASSAPADRCC